MLLFCFAQRRFVSNNSDHINQLPITISDAEFHEVEKQHEALFHITLVVLGLASLTFAGGYNSVTPCSEVENKSSHTLKYTFKFEDHRKGSNFCDT